MPVISLDARLDEYVRTYLEDKAPSEVEVIYSVAVYERVRECEHGDFTFGMVVDLSVGITRDDGSSYHVAGTVPLYMVIDGDMAPIHVLLEEVWQRTQFGSLVSDVDRELSREMKAEEQ